jgi:hypothetical protein
MHNAGSANSFWDRMRQLGDLRPCIHQGLEAAAAASDWSHFNCYILAAFRQHDNSMTSVLCRVLDGWNDAFARIDPAMGEGPHIEDIAELLGEIADPAAVPSLRRGIYNGPEWDEYQQFARKCIWSLGKIGTTEALAAIRMAAGSEDPYIKEYGADELEPNKA